MDKKILALLGILAVVMVGCAYAADTSDNNTVTVSGFNFTIPDGLSENADEAIINESDSEDGNNYVTNSRTFEDDEHFLVISVATYEQNITDDLISDLGDKTTIGNATGYYDEMGFFAMFSYVQDGSVVFLTSNDKNILEEALS